MNQQNIILTGFMGTGKSTVGKRLADFLKYDFVDSDQVIESRAGKTIADIFRDQGEAAFREMETALAVELSKMKGMVIATGGGMMVNSENADVLGATGRIFRLSADPEEILKRVKSDDGPVRPLLETPDPLERIKTLMAGREEAYSRFPEIRTTGKSPDEIVREIVDRVKSA